MQSMQILFQSTIDYSTPITVLLQALHQLVSFAERDQFRVLLTLLFIYVQIFSAH